MIKARWSDKKWVTELLVGSFARNPSVNYIIPDDKRRPERLAALMDYSFGQCMRFGEVWLSDDRRGCALLLFPQNKQTTLSSIWSDVKFIFRAVGIAGIPRVLRRERLVAQKRAKKDMIYLWFIGVTPVFQNIGVGNRLLTEILIHAESLGLPIYLGTSVTENLSWYKRFGFDVYDDLDLGYVLYFLRKLN